MEVRFWAATDVGRTRDHNEDNFLVDKKLNLFVVADGMGGHAAGEVASSVAVREVRKVLADGRAIVEKYAVDESAEGREAILKLIEKAIETACSKVFQLAQADASRKGMGTTLSLFLVAGHRGFIGHVGDSRIYLVRRSGVHQLTEDHSLVNELIKRGRLKPGDVFDSPYKNAVTRAVGVYEHVEVDAFDIDVLPEDGFLLCSDGLSCYLDDELTRRHMLVEDVKAIPDELIKLANDCGGKDNITAIVVRVAAGEGVVPGDRVTMVQRKTNALQAQPLFRYLSYSEIVKILNLSKRQTYEPGQVLFSEGDRVEFMHVVLSGRLSVNSRGRHLMDLSEDALLGESVLVEDAPRTVTVTAAEQTEILCIGRVALHSLMSNHAKLAWKLLWSLNQQQAMRLRNTGHELAQAATTIQALSKAAGVPAEIPEFDPQVHQLAHGGMAPTDEVDPPFGDPDTDRVTDPAIDRRSELLPAGETPAGKPVGDRGPTIDLARK
jgi:serine/threonine protein phosphatase PrpC